jgi:D-arabinose 1-dehydrogenase-like Zn-dependent alcohol dehydrogenase
MATGLKNPSVFLYNPGVAKIEESPYPEIKDAHDVILRIAYVGVCGSDVCSPQCTLSSQNSHTHTGPFLAPRWNHR